MPATFNINGRKLSFDLPEGATLLQVLRDHAELTGTKYGCGEGQCGACVVLVDNRAVPSCVTAAQSVQGKSITTIEGLAANGKLHPVQQAFLDTSAFQCAFCTPGMIMGAVGLLKSNPKPSDEQIREGLNNHICRCGTYPRIVEAVRLAASLGRETRRG